MSHGNGVQFIHQAFDTVQLSRSLHVVFPRLSFDPGGLSQSLLLHSFYGLRVIIFLAFRACLGSSLFRFVCSTVLPKMISPLSRVASHRAAPIGSLGGGRMAGRFLAHRLRLCSMVREVSSILLVQFPVSPIVCFCQWLSMVTRNPIG